MCFWPCAKWLWLITLICWVVLHTGKNRWVRLPSTHSSTSLVRITFSRMKSLLYFRNTMTHGSSVIRHSGTCTVQYCSGCCGLSAFVSQLSQNTQSRCCFPSSGAHSVTVTSLMSLLLGASLHVHFTVEPVYSWRRSKEEEKEEWDSTLILCSWLEEIARAIIAEPLLGLNQSKWNRPGWYFSTWPTLFLPTSDFLSRFPHTQVAWRRRRACTHKHSHIHIRGQNVLL